MKTKIFNILLCSILFSLLFNSKTSAQNIVNGKEVDTSFNSAMNHVFGNLDKSKVPFGLLRDYAMEFTNLENFNGLTLTDSNKIDKGVLFQIYNTLATARVTTGAYTMLPDPAVIDSLWFTARQPGQETICGLFYQYGYFSADAYSAGKITIASGQLFDKYVSGVYQNPYLQDKTVGFALGSRDYQGLNFNLNLPANLWLTNSSSNVDHIQVDPGDGSGYRTITPGVNLAVSYADTGMKVLNFKVFLTDASVLVTHTQLHISPDPLTLFGGGAIEGNQIINNGVRTGFYRNQYFVESTDTYHRIPGEGIITVKYAGAHTSLVKPLIVVEGFDQGIYTIPEYLNGVYSLNEFMLSVTNSSTLNLLLPTYDIVFIDFRNGTDDIHRNALVVESVIRWVNATKTGGNPNVVLGLSMGSLCARYALKTMENNGETHDTRLFISHGGPQQGAEIPVAFQDLIEHAHNLYMRAGPASALYSIVRLFAPSLTNIGGVVSLSETPAAEQMLITRIKSNFTVDNTIHDNWQNELKSLGYPSQGGIRNIAISNGSNCGQTQTLSPGGQVFLVDGQMSTSFLGSILSEIGGPVVAVLAGQPGLLLSVLPGRNTINLHFQGNAVVDGGGNQAYNGKITYTKTLFFLIPITVTLTDRTFSSPSGLHSFETFAGDNLTFNSSNNISSEWFGKYNITANFGQGFDFVPVTSVLDIGEGNTTLLESDYLTGYDGISRPTPKTTPFDNFITAYTPISPTVLNNNEAHISYDPRNGQWLANELNTPASSSGCITVCSANITGPANICETYSTFSVPTISGAAYQWSFDHTLVNVSGSENMPSLMLEAKNATPGSLTLTVTITYGDCGTVTLTQTVSVGPPIITQPITGPATICTNTASSAYSLDPVDGATFYNWSIFPATNTSISSNGSRIIGLQVFTPGNYSLSCEVTTPCGISFVQEIPVNVTALGPFGNCVGDGGGGGLQDDFIASPNPTGGGSLTIAPKPDPTGTVKRKAYTFELYDKKGKKWRTGKSANGDNSAISIIGLPKDIYFLHVTTNKGTVSKQIIIN
jgi:hypothetical protein